MAERLALLEAWLTEACGLRGYRLETASADASFRRYFRLTLSGGGSLIAMDAPPDHEDCGPFVAVAGRLRAAGLHVPQVVAQDLRQGFLLLEDLGTRSYLDALGPASVDRLYADALQALLQMQTRAAAAGLPPYDAALLRREMALFPDWLLQRHLGIRVEPALAGMLERAFAVLEANALAQPVVCVHRDYHSRNLMVVEGANPGVIDFQDAVAGPVTYDLVSLLRDCYVAWPAAQVDAWVAGYHAAADRAGLIGGIDRDTFLAWFDLMGVQRHLKAAGIFARLCHRDGKPGYLADIPRTLNYIVAVGRRREAVAELADWVGKEILPRTAMAG